MEDSEKITIRIPKRDLRYRREFLFVLTMMIVSFLAFILNPASVDTRQCAHLFPVGALLIAMIFFGLKEISRWAAGAFLAVYLLTDIFQLAPVAATRFVLNAASLDSKLQRVAPTMGPFSMKKELGKMILPAKRYGYYLYEITHHYRSATETIMDFLDANAQEGDYIYYPGNLATPAMFYADGKYRFVGVVAPENRAHVTNDLPDYVFNTDKVDWYIPRDRERYPEKIEKALGGFKNRGRTCTPVPLDCVDLAEADNIPWIRSHRFWTLTEGGQLIVYKIENPEQRKPHNP
jgi:hypothetical protein